MKMYEKIYILSLCKFILWMFIAIYMKNIYTLEGGSM
jgi:hypothetical protein